MGFSSNFPPFSGKHDETWNILILTCFASHLFVSSFTPDLDTSNFTIDTQLAGHGARNLHPWYYRKGPFLCQEAFFQPQAGRMSQRGSLSQDWRCGEGWEYFLLLLRRSHQRDGVVHLLSRHTTTALSINEDETRLREDQSWENLAIKCLFCWNFPITDATKIRRVTTQNEMLREWRGHHRIPYTVGSIQWCAWPQRSCRNLIPVVFFF